MPTLRYIGPIDEVDVVGVGVLASGDEFEATPDQVGKVPGPKSLGEGLLAQSDNFELVTKKKG